jgi:hypothetical protein
VKRFRQHPDSVAEVEAAARWYEHQGSGLGEEFLAVAHSSRRPLYWLDRR